MMHEELKAFYKNRRRDGRLVEAEPPCSRPWMALTGKELVRTLTYARPELSAALNAAKSLNCRGPAFESIAPLLQ